MINLKSQITCKICHKVFKKPVDLPCECICCLEHISDITKDFNNNNQMMCPMCKKVSYIPKNGFNEHLLTKRIVETNAYLSQDEKLLKNNFDVTFIEFNELFNELQLKESELEAIQREHFAELQKKLELTRDSLKYKIDKIFFQMSEMAKKSEESFKKKIASYKFKHQKEDMEDLKEKVAENFRNLSLNNEFTEILKIEQEQRIEEIKRNLDALEFLKLELKKYEFISNLEFESNSFGLLKLNGEENQDLISCSSDGIIKAWDLKQLKQLQMFKGHKSEVFCLESFKNNRLLSGSNDTTIKLWNIKTGECMMILELI